MKRIRKIMVMALMMIVAVSVSCIVHEDNHEDDDHGYYYTDDCCYYDPAPVEYWDVCSADITTISIGEQCDCGDCMAPCADCCSFSDYDYSLDTLHLSAWDASMIDLQFNFTLTNWGYETTYVWVSICDEIGCEDVIELALYPGEVYWDRMPNPVLDTAYDEFQDCLWFWGDQCAFDYDIDVYVGEECTCSPVTLDYFYEGLFVY